MSHAAALTQHAVSIWDGRHAAKSLARVLGCSYRAVEEWRARRRAMCLDHAIELAARNVEFHAALQARIEQARSTNDAASRKATTEVGSEGVALAGVCQAATGDLREQGQGFSGDAAGPVAVARGRA